MFDDNEILECDYCMLLISLWKKSMDTYILELILYEYVRVEFANKKRYIKYVLELFLLD